MSQRKIPIPLSCGLHLVREALNGKWKISLLYLIGHGTRRPHELLKKLPEATRRVLYAQLKELETHELVTKTVFAELPLRVEYQLTPCGESLLPVIAVLGEWGQAHEPRLRRVLGLAPAPAPAAT